MILYQDASNYSDNLKNKAAKGFLLNFKNLLVTDTHTRIFGLDWLNVLNISKRIQNVHRMYVMTKRGDPNCKND